VVATHLPENDEIIDHGRTGLLVPVGDASALAKACVRLLRDDAERRNFGDAARRVVLDRFDRKHWLERMMGVYKRGFGLP
jgi:glycosyltransferase involved in cell wall biosynthesis